MGEDVVAFQVGTNFFKMYNQYLLSSTGSMLSDTANANGLYARGLFCKSYTQFFSLMYGVYNGINERIWIAEIDFSSNKITYRQYLP